MTGTFEIVSPRRVARAEWILCLAASVIAAAGLALVPHQRSAGPQLTVTRPLPTAFPVQPRQRLVPPQAGAWQTQQILWPSRSRM